jgi:hypothetical protein
MFVAGGVIWTNATPLSDGSISTTPSAKQYRIRKNYLYGWPKYFAESETVIMTSKNGKMTGDKISETHSSGYSKLYLTINALVGLAMLFAVWFACEWRIRRRASVQ